MTDERDRVVERILATLYYASKERRTTVEREVKALREEAERFREDYGNACHLVAQMHAAAVGCITGPKRGVVEDVADVASQVETAWGIIANATDWDNPERGEWREAAERWRDQYHASLPGNDEPVVGSDTNDFAGRDPNGIAIEAIERLRAALAGEKS